ncbi:unnamed protein product [Peniophora sp. CBMAI 1063]|nr:unnamed protein product [Peniophora sp. CBMAI 1063]
MFPINRFRLLAAFYIFSSLSAVNCLPSQVVMVDPLDLAVMGPNANFRNDTFDQLFNPTNTTPPFFQVFDKAFLDILGPNAAVRRVAFDPTFAFADEAPIWNPPTDEVFFAAQAGTPIGHSDIDHNSQVSKISLREVAQAAARVPSKTAAVNVTVTALPLSNDIQMTNGGTNFRGDLLFVTTGRGPLPPTIARVNPKPPYNDTVLLDNFFGRQFNSVNDVKVHPTSGVIFFTDSTYGFLSNYRPLPLLPNQVYRLDPDTRQIRVVADGFIRCNGIAFTGDGKTAYVSDTAAAGRFLGLNGTEPATIYRYDVEPVSQVFTGRRVFAYVDSGVPDGIQVDARGNVYSGCADGVQVWNSNGVLLGKIFLGTSTPTMTFAGDGRLVIMADTAIYLAQIAARALDLPSFGM